MKKIKYKKTIIASVIALGLAVPTVFYFTGDSIYGLTTKEDAMSNLSSEHQANVAKEEGKQLIKINNKVITSKQFSFFKEGKNFIQRLNGSEPLSDEVLQKELITIEVTLDQAEKEGISISRNEAKKFAEQQKEYVLQDPAQTEFYNQLIDALGYTDERYWNQYAVTEYQRTMAISQLKTKYYNAEKAKNAYITLDEFEAVWADLQAKWVSEATVQIL